MGADSSHIGAHSTRLFIRRDDWIWDYTMAALDDVKTESVIKTQRIGLIKKSVKGVFHDPNTGWHGGFRYPGILILTGSIPRLYPEANNLGHMDVNSIDRVHEYIDKIKKLNGFRFRNDKLRMGRIDVKADWKTKLPVDVAIRELGKVGTVDRMRPQVDAQHYNGEYLRRANTQKQHVIYRTPQGLLRSEVRLMKPEACKQHGIVGIDDLRNTSLLAKIWKKMNRAIIDQAIKEGIYMDDSIACRGIADQVADLLRTPNAPMSSIASILASFNLGGFYLDIGGESKLERWVASLRLQPYRKKRFLDKLGEIARHSKTRALKRSDIWTGFENWVESLT